MLGRVHTRHTAAAVVIAIAIDIGIATPPSNAKV